MKAEGATVEEGGSIVKEEGASEEGERAIERD